MRTPSRERIIVDVDARLHLEHTDVAEHAVRHVKGRIVSEPGDGTYDVTLEPEVPFDLMTSGPCVILVILFVLDWPKDASLFELRDLRDLPDPKNFLDLSDGEYSAQVRLDFEDGYAFKRVEMKKNDDGNYSAKIETVHRYPSTKSEGLVRIMPHDITLVDAGPGRALGRGQVRWLASDGTYVSGDAVIEVDFKNRYARLPAPQIFSYEFEHSEFSETPFTLSARGSMRAVDRGPDTVTFDEMKQRYRADRMT